MPNYVLPSNYINRLHTLGYGADTTSCPKCKDRIPMCEVKVNGTKVILHEVDIDKIKEPKNGHTPRTR